MAKIKQDDMDVVKYTKRDLAHFDENAVSVILDIILRKKKEPEVAKKQKIIPDLNMNVVKKVNDGGRWFTYCNLFCCKDVVPDYLIGTELYGEQFRLFLNAIQGLSMKDLFMYVLKKEYMDIGPKQSVFRDLFGDRSIKRT